MSLAITFQLAVIDLKKIMQRYKQEREAMFNKKRISPTLKTTHAETIWIGAKSTDNPRMTATEIHKEFSEEGGSEISVVTIRRSLRKAGLNARRPIEKPLISFKIRRNRLDFAKSHKDWIVNQWREVNFCYNSLYFSFIFTDNLE